MNNKDLKNKLKNEIESITPRVYDNVVQSSYIQKPEAVAKKKTAGKSFKIAMSAVACVLIVAVAVTCGILLAPEKVVSNYYYVQVSAGQASASADEAQDNAKITLTLNNKETVETARAENIEGDMVLRIAGEVKDMKFDDAIAKIHKASVELKFASDEDGFDVFVAGEKAEKFVKDIKGRISFSINASVFSKDELLKVAQKYSRNATLSNGFEELTSAIANRKSFLEEAWSSDKSIFSEIYYQFAEEEIDRLKIGTSEYLKDFKKGTYAEMIDNLKDIENVFKLLGWTELQEKVEYIRTSLESIDFAKIKVLYDNYITGLINDILNPSEQTLKSLF